MDDFKSLKPISFYSTKQAVEDGFLIQVDQKISQEAGIRYPVYLTRAVWDKYVEVSEGMESHQYEAGRLWDVLFIFAFLPGRNLRPTCFLSCWYSCRIRIIGSKTKK